MADEVSKFGLFPANIKLVPNGDGTFSISTTAVLASSEIGSLTETAPATDTASSGLNGRLQRIAQRITSLIALLPAALGAGGGLKVDGSGTALPVAESGGAYATPTHTAPTAGVATGVILAANANRLYALFVNDSDTSVYLALGVAAVVNTGIRINANGGSYEMSKRLGNLYTGAVNGISGIAGKVVLVTEGV